MHDFKIYDVESYKPFNFKAHLDNAYLRVNLKNTVIFSNSGYFAISEENFEHLLNKKELTVLKIDSLNRQGIVVGKRGHDSSNSQVLFDGFLKPLIKEEIYCLRYFLKLIAEHLENRESEGQKLINHENIRILIGEVVQFIEEVEVVLELDNLDKSMKKHIAKVMRKSCNHVAKLAGGRSFISSNVIDMLCTFEVLNNIYLK